MSIKINSSVETSTYTDAHDIPGEEQAIAGRLIELNATEITIVYVEHVYLVHFRLDGAEAGRLTQLLGESPYGMYWGDVAASVGNTDSDVIEFEGDYWVTTSD